MLQTSHLPLLSLTKSMLSAAEAGDWDNVETMELKRQAVLQKLQAAISVPVGRASRDMLTIQLRAVLSLNDRLLALGQQAKAELVNAIGGLNQGRKAVHAYLK